MRHYDIQLHNGDDTHTTANLSDITFIADVELALDSVTQPGKVLEVLGSFLKEVTELEKSKRAASLKQFPTGAHCLMPVGSDRA